MTRFSLVRKIVLTSLCLVIVTNVWAQSTPEVMATVDVSETGAPIHRYVYGMFTELLGNIFEHGLWAEMLSDRKFFYPVDTTSTLTPINTRRNQNRWRPVGGADVVIMDHNHSYVGEHTPVIRLSGSTPYGIQQSGLALRAGKNYTGSVVLSGDGDVTINVSLVWGSNPDDRQTIPIHSLTNDYLKYPLSFAAGADIDNGRLEITGTGSGSFRIGAV